MRQRVAENSAANFAELKAIQRKLSGWSAAAFASGLAALAMTWYILVFLIARPVTTLVGAMRRIATGDTTAGAESHARQRGGRHGARGPGVQGTVDREPSPAAGRVPPQPGPGDRSRPGGGPTPVQGHIPRQPSHTTSPARHTP